MNTNERPTPETDAVTVNIQPEHASAIKGIVPAFFARCLERERDEACDRIADLEKQLAELQKPREPEIFKSHGLTWIKHVPGNPMPCDGETDVRILYGREKKGVYRDSTNQACFWDWSDGLSEEWQIIGWNYAEAP